MNKLSACFCTVLIVFSCFFVGGAYYSHLEYLTGIEERIGFLENRNCINKGLAIKTVTVVSKKISELRSEIEVCKYAIQLLHDRIEENKYTPMVLGEEHGKGSNRGSSG